MKRSLTCVALASALVLTACPKKSTISPLCSVPPSTLPSGTHCDPMVVDMSGVVVCGFPFPSNAYLAKDESATATCGKVQLPDIAHMPALSGAAPADPKAWSGFDGFSPGQSPMTYLMGATTKGLPDQFHIGDSLKSDCPTVLIDTSTNPPTRVAHFDELDLTGGPANIDTDGTEYDNGDETFMIRPSVRLKNATRYIVAIRHVKDRLGADLPVGNVFKALRDGTSSSDPTVSARKAAYADIFAKLKAAGIDKSDLQMAWDYTTASTENITGQLVSMRDQAFKAIGAKGPGYAITDHTDMPDATNPADRQFIARTIKGTFHVPLFLDHGAVTIDADKSMPDLDTGYTLQTDASGKPKMNGYADFDFLVQIPLSVWNDSKPAPILVQGHGLFSDRSEGQSSNTGDYFYLNKLANDFKYVTISVDLLGWRTPGDASDANQEDDQEKAQGLLLPPSTIAMFKRMVDRGTQGMLNQLVAVRLMKTSLAADPLMQNGGHALVNTTTAYYRGDSQGGIYGTTFMALTPDIERGYVGETGMPYSFLVMRSLDFAEFLSALVPPIGLLTLKSVQYSLALMQMFWDRLEPDGFAPYVSGEKLPGTGITHHVLINVGEGDHQVSTIGAEILARSVGAKNITPLIPAQGGYPGGEVYGLDDAASISDGQNGFVLFGYNLPFYSTTNKPPDDDNLDPHDWIRQVGPVYKETDTFLRTGTAGNVCNGVPCVFPYGNCNSNTVTACPTGTACDASSGWCL